ncbi:MAG: BNR-repeat neuraminidase N-terminal domain-containing protein [Bacteroidota bacterium]
MKYFYLIILYLLSGLRSDAAGYNVTRFPNPNFCSTYPSVFTTGSFSIFETSRTKVKGFKGAQLNKTLILGFSNSSFQFNPGVGTVTATGTDVTIVSYSITSTAITVTLSTAATNTELNTINFNNVQIRATTAATGFIQRTGGSFLIDNKTSNPFSGYSWGNLTAGTPIAYASSTATQAITSAVFSGSSDNQVLGIQEVITGTCSSLNGTTFNFNTTGSTAAFNDIASAKLYYTGTTNSFSTTTLFGTASNPSGAFSITGSQLLNLGAGTYYFWLVYDLKGTATSGNLIDAQLVSTVLSGTTYNAVSGNPAGTRTISTNIFYSIAAGNWSNTAIWSKTSGGVSCGCAPVAGNGLVFVNHAVLLDISSSVDNVTVQNNGNLTNAASQVLTVTNTLSTSGTGLFAATSNWVVNNILTAGSGTSTTSAAFSLTGALTVGSGTILQVNGGVLLTVNGNLAIDGTLALASSGLTSSNSAGTILTGTGFITGSGTITLGVNKTIPAVANLTISPVLVIASGVTVTNNGTVNMQNNISGGNATSQWTNAANSVLNMGGTTSAILATGTLDASAVPNTVNYSGSGNQTIKIPASGYYNLYASSSGTGIKTPGAAVIVNNDVQLSAGAQLNIGANTLTLYGNWINNSTNTTPFVSTGSVIFNGTTQVSGTGITSFNIVNISASGTLTSNSITGKIIVGGNWINEGDFNANNSNITFNGTSTISGSSITNFFTVIVNGSKTLTLSPVQTDVEGDLTVNGTLNHNNGLLVFSGEANFQNINGTNVAQSLYQVELDNSNGSVIMSKNVTVSIGLTLTNGTWDIGSKDLTFSSTASAVGGSPFTASNMIIASGGGRVYKNGTSAATASYLFPVGDNTGTSEYSPITISFGAGTYTSGSTSVKLTNAKHPSNLSTANYLNRFWTVATTGYTITSAVVTATYTDADIVGAETGILMARYGGSLPWTDYPSSVNAVTNFLTSPAINAFGDFSGISDPVQWTGNISTDWGTAGNWNNNIVPTAVTSVTIPATATRMPSVFGTANCSNLTINTGATVTNTSTGILNIAGTLSNNGIYTDNGTSVFSGTTGQQTFSGVTAFYNLTLNNSDGLLLPSAITINNNLTLSAGIFNAANYNLSVRGNWVNNVSVNAFTAGITTVSFNGTTPQIIGGSFSTSFNNVVISNASNTVSLNINTNISGDLSVTAGVFDLAVYTANRSSLGGILTVANNATLKIGGTNSYPSNYSINNLVVASTVMYAGTNQAISNQTYGNLALSNSGGISVKTFPATALAVVGNFTSSIGSGTLLSFTAASNITISGNVFIGASTIFNAGTHTINVGGNWVDNGVFNGNSGTTVFQGPGSMVSGGGTDNFNSVTVAASQITFTNPNITLSGNLATVFSGSFSQPTGSTIIMNGTGTTISGNGIEIENLTINGSVSTATSLIVSGNLAVGGSFAASTGTITMSGSSKTITGAGSTGFYILSVRGSVIATASFAISNSLSVTGAFTATAGTATFTSISSLSGIANLFNVTINGTSLQLAADATMGIANIMTVTAGMFNATSTGPNTVNFNGPGAQTINALTYSNLVLSNGNIKTAAGAISTAYDLTIGSNTTFTPGAFTHSIWGSWTNNGSFIAGTSTIQFAGSATANITGATTFNILTSNTSSATTELILNDNIVASIVNMTNGIIATGTDTITITNTRTGNGFIFGNITRTHAFATGLAYAFEGPDNTIIFSALSAVTSITVSVTKQSIADFPYGNCIRRLYAISIPSGTYTAALRMHYEDAELNGNTESDMGFWNYDGTQWIPRGKTANNTSSNYVEQTAISALNGRWTISINPTVVLWTGAVSSDWSNAGNWPAYVGPGSTPPAASDVAVIGAIPFLHQPQISSAVIVKNVVFGSAQSTTLSMLAGGSLISGDIVGFWTANTSHNIQANNQTITINGSLSLSDGIAGHEINLGIGNGTVNVNGSLVQAGNAAVSFTGAGSLAITKDYNATTGTFTAGAGTVVYNGTENQHIAQLNYNHLTINKTAGLAAIDAIVNIAGDLSVVSGQLDNISTINISGSVTIAPGATLHNDYRLYVGGNWNNTGNYLETGNQVIFNGSGAQIISATTFNNLVINKTGASTASLNGNIIINGDLTIASGIFDVKTFDCNRSLQGGSFTISNNATFIVGGNNSPLYFSNHSFGNTSNYVANGIIAQSIAGVEFGNLIFRNNGLKTLLSPITVNGDLTIETNAIFDAGTQTITLDGNFIDDGTLIPSTSTVICTGTAKNISGNPAFYRLSVYGSYTFLNDVTINRVLIINASGALTGGPSINTTLHGDLINRGILYTLGTTTFSGNVLQTLSLINAIQTVAINVNFNGTVSPVLNSTSPPQYGYLNINNTGGITPSVGWVIAYGLTVGNGSSFNAGNFTHTILGNVANNGIITSSGTLNLLPTAAATLNLGNFTSTGTVVFGGAGAITMAGGAANFYDVIVSNTNTAGLTPSADWNISRNLVINNGSTLHANTFNFTVGGNMTNNGRLDGDGRINLLPASAATANFGSNFYNTGTLVFGGFGQLDLSGTPASLYNVVVSNTNARGISPSSNWIHTNHFTINNDAIFHAGGYSYHVNGDLINLGTINSGTSTFVFEGTNAQTLSSPSDFNHIVLNKTIGSLTLATAVRVNGQFNFSNGIINTSSANLLSFGTFATVSGTPGNNSYINGPAAKLMDDGAIDEFSFPIGKSTAQITYHPCGIKPVAVAGGNTIFTAEYFDAPLQSQSIMSGTGLTAIIGDGYWDIHNSSSVSTARVKLQYDNPGSGNWIHYNGSSLAPYYEAAVDPCATCNVAVVHHDQDTKSWAFTSTAGMFSSADIEYRSAQDQGYIYTTPQSDFSPFSIGYSYGVILPVKLMAFTGVKNQNNALLSWEVAAVADLAGFELEAGNDGQHFTKLATIAASTNSRYSYTDKVMIAGKNYYRLLVKDKNGKSFYSHVIVLINETNGTIVKGLLQNPAGAYVTPLIYVATAQPAQAIITDASGKLLGSYQYRLMAGENKWPIAITNMAKGIYFLNIRTDDGQQTTLRFIKD